MKFTMGMGFEQRLEQKVDLGQKLEQKTQLRQMMQQRLTELLRSTPDAPEKIADDVLGRAVGALPAQVQDIFKNALSGFPTIGATMMEYTELLALANDERLREFALRVMFDMQKGQFFEEDSDKSRRATFFDIEHALREPQWAVTELARFDALLAESGASTGGFLDSRARLQKAANLAETLGPTIGQLATVMRHILGAKDPQTGETVQMCIREHAISERFLPIASERIEQRLVTNMKKILARDQPDRFENATLNSIGETALVGLGILSPDLFQLQGISQDSLVNLDNKFLELGMTPEAMQRLYATQQQRGICWHRWKTTTRRPGALTDLMVREFITEHLRQDREELLVAADYPDFFTRAKEWAKSLRAEKDPDEREALVTGMGSLAMEMLGRDELHDCLKQLATKSWYRDLDEFLQK